MPEVVFKRPTTSNFAGVVSKDSPLNPFDIIVPIHGRLDLTMKCVRAIYDNTTAPFHLIVLDDTVDDGDPDALSQEYFKRFGKKHDNVTYVHSPKPYKEGNEFFNEGLKHCKYDFVAVVMNSITVQPDWEIIALQYMKGNPQVGIMGFKCLLPSGVIESAGITMMGFTPIDIGRDAPGYTLNSLHECIAVQWAFAMLRKAAVVGNLEEGIFHGFVGWDDIDNSFAVRSKGWKIMYCGQGVGIHEQRSTRGKDTVDALQRNRENAEKFYKRWGYWDLYQKANEKGNIHLKSRLAEEVSGLAFSLKAKGRNTELVKV